MILYTVTAGCGDSPLSTSTPELRPGGEEEPLTVEEPGERRGVTMTTAFYKALLARIAEEDKQAADATVAVAPKPELAAPSAAPSDADNAGLREHGAALTKKDLDEIKMLREQEKHQKEQPGQPQA